jgi:amidophosphoribosyltransferase
MCGVIGIIHGFSEKLQHENLENNEAIQSAQQPTTKNSGLVAHEIYQGLLTLQHRGQDAAGIMAYDYFSRRFNGHKNHGLVSDVFSEEILRQMTGSMAIGHNRYQTIGNDQHQNIQPMIINYPFGMAMAHNGNVVNYFEITENLRAEKNRHLFTDNDLEALLNLLSDSLAKHSLTFSFQSLVSAVETIFEMANGAYAVVGMVAGEGLFAFRDPFGIRPLVLGKKVNDHQVSYVVASESNALRFLGYELVRDVLPGEIIFIDQWGKLSSHQTLVNGFKPCMFEWIYFSNPESIIEEKLVYGARGRLGLALAEKIKLLMSAGKIDPHVVIPVPETARIAATSIGESIGVPVRELLIKNRYVQRSFILKSPAERKNAVEMKLTPISSEIRGKNILLVDDSIVRGTTSKHMIKMCKDAGAKKVYFASTCPEIKNPCFYGIDFPSKAELVANEKNHDQIADSLAADEVIYLDLADLKTSLGIKDACIACLDGDYPSDVKAGELFSQKRHSNKDHEILVQ